VTPQQVAHCRKSDSEIQSVRTHLEKVGRLSRNFAGKLDLSEIGELAGLLHDAGKVSEQFQQYIKSATGVLDPDLDDEYVETEHLKGKIDHSTAGAQWIWEQLKDSDSVTAQAIALCIASHHSGLIDCVGAGETNFGRQIFARRMRKADSKSNRQEVFEKIPTQIEQRCNEILGTDPDSFFQRCKKIHQRYKGNQNSLNNHLGLLIRFLFSCLIDADRTDTANFEFPHLENLRGHDSPTDWGEHVNRLEKSISNLKAKHEIDHARAAISLRCKEMALEPQRAFTLSVPTGGGKTWSSLRFALHHAKKHDLDRVLYVIPYTSIIDQNAKATRKILSDRRRELVLEIHSNLTPRKQTYRDKVLAANWDAPIVFTTMVQFLESLYGGGTRGARRMHQLANSVIIFDEIQSLPIKCVHLFNQAANFLVEQCGSSIVLCTATQPLLHNVDPAKGNLHLETDSEITEQRDKLYAQLKRTIVKDETNSNGWSNVEIADLAVEQTSQSGSCLVITNTKKMARSVFEMIGTRELAADAQLFHLSTNMCPAHRKKDLYLIRRMLDTGIPVVCVSTQLIEAGVDVDFGAAIRFLAGLDSIAQAAGRCNRNGIRDSGSVFVVNAKEESLKGLPDIELAIKATNRVLGDYASNPEKYDNDLIGPKAMEWFYKNYFYARSKDMDYPVPASKLGHDDSILNLLGENRYATAETNRGNEEIENLCFRQAFMTAGKAFDVIDAPTEGIVVPYGRRGKQLIGRLASEEFNHNPFPLLKQAQQFTVNVFPRDFAKLKDAGAIKSLSEEFNIFHLDECFYDPKFGLSTEPVTEMELLSA
jgi:CRISPR-associated endonuclease/helicase Cas3